MVKRLDRLGVNCAHIMQLNLYWEWTQVVQIGHMGHKGEHFDEGLSRGHIWCFKGVNISSKVWEMPRSPEKTN